MNTSAVLQPLYTKEILLDFDVILYKYSKLKWFESVVKVDDIHGQGGNKLCTYRQFKTELHVEHYVSEDSALATFQCGVKPLQVQIGRYSNGPSYRMLFILCDKQQVEGEFDVLIACDL